jgi:16S rRNA (guanine966-N2)-methyltransferase
VSLRIISGDRRGAKIAAPEGMETRPLRDRIREALMSMMRNDLRAGGHVLDCFAGSGAVGLECLSNGAGFATFVESSPAACAVIRSNIEKLRYEAQSHLLKGEAPAVLRGYRPATPFDFLLLMPPYHSGLCSAVLGDRGVTALCAPDCTAVCEIHREEPVPDVAGWKPLREKSYGITRILFLQREESV